MGGIGWAGEAEEIGVQEGFGRLRRCGGEDCEKWTPIHSLFPYMAATTSPYCQT